MMYAIKYLRRYFEIIFILSKYILCGDLGEITENINNTDR